MRVLFLGNDWDVTRTGLVARGVPLPVDVTVRCLLTEEKGGDPIHATLAVAVMERPTENPTDDPTAVPGYAIATVQGYNLTDHLDALLAEAEDAGKKLVIYEEVIVDDEDYHDYEPLEVERFRRAGTP